MPEKYVNILKIEASSHDQIKMPEFWLEYD